MYILCSQQSLGHTHSEWRPIVCPQPKDASSARVSRYAAHLAVDAGGNAVLEQDIVIVTALSAPEAAWRIDGFGIVFHGSAMGAASGHIDTAAGLATTKVGIEVGMAQRQIETQLAGIRMNRLHVQGVRLG